MKSATFLLLLILGLSSYAQSQSDKTGDNRFRIKKGSFYGFIDHDGVVKIDPVYSAANYFSDGLASVKEAGASKSFYIDVDGKPAFKGSFDIAGKFEEGRAVVKDGGKYGVIDKDGNWISKPMYKNIYTFSERFSFYQTDSLYGVMDYDGNQITPAIFKSVSGFQEGLAKVVLNKKQCFIDTTGTVIIEHQFNTTYSFQEGLAEVRGDIRNPSRKGKYGFINKTGELVIDTIYDDVADFSHGVTIGVKKDTVYLINNSGIIIKRYDQFYDYDDLTEGMGIVLKEDTTEDGDDLAGVIDSTGKLILEPIYAEVSAYSEGFAFAEDAESEKYALVDDKGHFITKFIYDDVDDFEDGLAEVEMAHKKCYINTKGIIVWKDEK